MSLAQLDRARTALLVVDMQNAFVSDRGTLGLSGVSVASTQECVPRIAATVEVAEAAGVPVLWTRQVHLADDVRREAKRIAPHTARRKQIAALAGSWDAEIVDELVRLASDPTMIVVKHRFGAFYETRLEALLRMLGTQSLLICGTTANACVETTMREAYMRDYDVVAIRDCVPAVRTEWMAQTLAIWEQYLGKVASSEEVIAWLGSEETAAVDGVGHILLEAVDLDLLANFYLKVLGLTERKRGETVDGRPLIVTDQGIGLTNGKTDGGTSGFDHLALRVHGLEKLVERVEEANCTILRGPQDSEYGTSFYIADPEGNVVELIGSRR